MQSKSTRHTPHKDMCYYFLIIASIAAKEPEPSALVTIYSSSLAFPLKNVTAA